MNDLSVFVFLVVILMGFGYTAGNSRNFGFFKLVLLLVFLVPFMISLSISKTHLMVMLVSFLIGYFLPYSYLLKPLSEGLSDFINNIRYRDAYEDIRRQEEEIRKKYEEGQSKDKANDERKEQARQKRQREYEGFRQKQDSGSNEEESQSGQSDTQEFTRSPDARRNHYLRVLGLDPDREYSQADIKKAFRRMAAKYHPDKHQGKPDAVVREMEARFREVVEAFEWLVVK